MQAAYIAAANNLSLREVPIPLPGPDEVRVRIEYVGLCGSDLHYYFTGANGAFEIHEPLIPGHECSGFIDVDPSGTFAPGLPVTVHPAIFGTPQQRTPHKPHLWPNGSYLGSASTWPHTQGALRELITMPRSNVRPLPEHLPLRTAALTEPLAVAMHGISQAPDLRDQRVLVMGAGPIGLLTLSAAHAARAEKLTITDIVPGPLERASRLAPVRAINVTHDALGESEFDVVFECSGVPASIASALHSVRPAGTVVQLGMMPNEARPLNIAPFISKEVRWRGSFRFHDEINAAIALLADRPEIETVITHEFSLADAAEAFRTARDSQESGKVLIRLRDD